jgi:transposase InsO family protein
LAGCDLEPTPVSPSVGRACEAEVEGPWGHLGLFVARSATCDLAQIELLARSAVERQDVLDTLHSKRLVDKAPAETPNQVWSWDITRLLGPAKWTYFYLYVILDVFSRYGGGWMVADSESAPSPKPAAKQGIEPWSVRHPRSIAAPR